MRYRVFQVDDERRSIVDFPIVIECDNDAAAIEYARHIRNGHLVEIRDRYRVVAILARDGRTIAG